MKATLKQKLKKVPSPIREMIVENTNDHYGDWKGYADTGNIGNAFIWQSAKHIPDAEFWCLINEEIELMP